MKCMSPWWEHFAREFSSKFRNKSGKGRLAAGGPASSVKNTEVIKSTDVSDFVITGKHKAKKFKTQTVSKQLLETIQKQS